MKFGNAANRQKKIIIKLFCYLRVTACRASTELGLRKLRGIAGEENLSNVCFSI